MDKLSTQYLNPFDDPPKPKPKNVGVIVSGGDSNYKPGKNNDKDEIRIET